MVSDDTVYGVLLVFSVAFGLYTKNLKGVDTRQTVSTIAGFCTILLICHLHVFHSIITVIGTCVVLKCVPHRNCHIACFIWNFGYLVVFRTVHLLGIPAPPPLSNAVQLFLTLRMIGLAFEIHDSRMAVFKEDATQEEKRLIKKYVHIDPSFSDIFSYAYCYIGMMTGPYYKYRTYQDWLEESNTEHIATRPPFWEKVKPLPLILACFLAFSHYFNIQYVETDEFSDQPFWFRLFYMMPMFIIFRTRLYIAWLLSECMCITSALGAYPVKSKPKCGQGPTDLKALEDTQNESDKKSVEYNFQSVHNLDIWGCELAPTTREGLRSWNMTVQYWLATYIHRRIPANLKAYRVSITMGVSAFWHGIHPGYYLSFLTVPPILMAETAMSNTFRRDASPLQQQLFDWGCWFFKMRGFDYMCMGFLLLRLNSTLNYWCSIYFTGHIVVVLFLVIGNVFMKKTRREVKKD
ncbi:lysophospholipid acyltransferase 7-like [Haliotis rufescens]|uniref:lysophospholipid acyltransferase 7-like n=1 Tax=Haliotis rufescens TaxID=6454 RepID=UPI00201FAFC0|nr:lysophospholipid acyltransferase 7-like [Haliotis rufescens]